MQILPDYCISSGKFARLCGTTRDTLRYYHRQGILVPQKDEQNGYYYYSYAQMASFFFIRTFRELGCSAEDIRTYLLGGEQARFDAFVDRQYEALLQEREKLEQRIAVIGGTRELLKEIRGADQNETQLKERPPAKALKVTKVRSAPATSAGEIMPDILRHLERCRTPGVQAFPMGASMAREDFLKGCYSYRQVFSFAMTETEEEDVIRLEQGPCVVRVCRESDGDIQAIYREMTEFITKHRLRPISDFFSLSMVNVIDPHKTRRYLKLLFCCVEPEGKTRG